MLPQTNARLVSITRPESAGNFTEDYDQAAVNTAPAVWQGNADAYVQTKIRSNFNERGELNRVLEVTLFVSVDDLSGVELMAGDTLTYEAGDPSSPKTLAGRIQTFTDPAYLPTMLDYYKLALEEVNVPSGA